jgi:hypothetical protein
LLVLALALGGCTTVHYHYYLPAQPAASPQAPAPAAPPVQTETLAAPEAAGASVPEADGRGLAGPVEVEPLTAPAPPLPALLVEVEGAGQPFPSVDKDHHVIFVPQTPSRTDILTQTPDGSVQGTVLAIDLTTGRVKVRTDAGQVVTLAMAYGNLATMHIGDAYTFVVRPRGRP